MTGGRALGAIACAAIVATFAPGCAALVSWDQFSQTAGDAGGGGDAGGRDDGGGDGATADTSGGDAGGAIAFVQANAVALDNMSRSIINVPFKSPQVAGDLNVLVIGWYDTTVSLATVTDSSGNAYQLAGAPTSVTGSDPIVQAIYYAPHIAAAAAEANVVTVTWDNPACAPDVRVVEFRGVDTLDETAGSAGLDGPASVTMKPTKTAPELLVAGGTSTSGFSTADPPYTLAIVSIGADIVEYRVAGEAAMFTAAPPLVNGKSWVMQLAAFR